VPVAFPGAKSLPGGCPAGNGDSEDAGVPASLFEEIRLKMMVVKGEKAAP